MTQGEQQPSTGKLIPISLAYAPTPEVMLYKEIEVADGTQLIEALAQVGWLDTDPSLRQWCEQHKDAARINNKEWRVGVFSYKKQLSYVLQAHDRVEVYRPLSVDPMRKRQRRVTQQQ